MRGKKTEVRVGPAHGEGVAGTGKKETVRRAAARMLAIANALDGMTFTKAARAAGIERQSLGDAVKRYNSEGIDGFYDRTKPGRPRKLNEAQERHLAEIIIAGPDPEKDGISAYTLQDLCAIAKQRFAVRYQPTGMSNVIKRLGFSRQKARPRHPEKDAAAQAAFKGAQ